MHHADGSTCAADRCGQCRSGLICLRTARRKRRLVGGQHGSGHADGQGGRPGIGGRRGQHQCLGREQVVRRIARAGRQEDKPAGRGRPFQNRIERPTGDGRRRTCAGEGKREPAEFGCRAAHPGHAPRRLTDVVEQTATGTPVRDRGLPRGRIGGHVAGDGAGVGNDGRSDTGRRIPGAERHPHHADADRVTRGQRAVARDRFRVHGGAVATLQIADDPAAVPSANLGMHAAGPFIVQDDVVGGSTAERDQRAGPEPHHALPGNGVDHMKMSVGC